MVIGKHGIQTFKVEVVAFLLLLLLFDVFVFTNAHPLIILDNQIFEIYLNISTTIYPS